MKILRFANKDTVQAIGLGTWKAKGNEVKQAVKDALYAGVRHIDTAAVYDNEEDIGQALAEVFAEGAIPREDVFVTSKLWNDSHQKGYVIPAVMESLKKLQLDYLDLYLIHWPVVFKPGVGFPQKPSDYIPLDSCPIIETWREMETIKTEGYARHIGVSNFSKTKLEDLVDRASIKPEMNQVELHPLLQQNELLEYCNNQDIFLTAYSPLGSGDRPAQMKGANEPNLMAIADIMRIAAKHNSTSAQVLLSWHAHRGCAVIPKSTSKEHIRSNFLAANLRLDAEDMKNIAGLDEGYRFIDGTFFEMPGSGYTNIYDA